MIGLARVFLAKIVLTFLLWCIPLLLFPASVLTSLGFPVPEPQVFLRLLGTAYVALVVGYAFALRAISRDEYPASAVWVGIVSNGGAFLILIVAAYFGAWASWGALARLFMWASLAATGAVTAALILFGRGKTRKS